jgi:hypothetical protein
LKEGRTPLHLAAGMAALLAWSAAPAAALEAPDLQGVLITGYNLGQNGQGWPQPWKEPLANYNRGGFYLSQARLRASLPFDSTFGAVVQYNLIFADLQEAYLHKSWGTFRLKAGKLRGAGLKSGSGTDETEQTLVIKPRYARLWNEYKRLVNFADFGVQAEKDWMGGRFRHKLFLHNANRENVFNDEPSFPAGTSTQALGVDYAVEYQVSPYTTLGGHAGALADRQWDEFVGSHDFWEVGYWFKSNPVVDASVFHRMDFARFHMMNEALLMSNRLLLHPDDERPMRTWGVSTLARFDHSPRWSPFLSYEFVDQSDGYYPDDALQMFKLGTLFRPSPERHPGLRFTGEYVRALEEGGRNRIGNDILYAQLQAVF